jgi:hypothetical protein
MHNDEFIVSCIAESAFCFNTIILLMSNFEMVTTKEHLSIHIQLQTRI